MREIKSFDDCYCVKFDIKKEDGITPQDFLAGMHDVLLNLEAFNHAIINSFDETMQVVSYIEELEGGSIKIWIRDKLKLIEDKDIDRFVNNPIKTTISSLLKKSKNIAIEKLGNESNNDIVNAINDNIKDSNVENPLTGISLDKEKLLIALSNISKGSKRLKGRVAIIFDYNNQEESMKNIPTNFEYTQENELLNEATQTDDIQKPFECKLRIKKPDLDGKSKWECYWNKKISVTIKDEEFINKVKSGLPVSSKTVLKVNLEIINKIDNNGDIIENAEIYNVINVLEIIEYPDKQLSFFNN